jgi:hypothetical protein
MDVEFLELAVIDDCRSRLRTANLLAIDRDGELRIALIRVLGHVQHERIRAAAD